MNTEDTRMQANSSPSKSAETLEKIIFALSDFANAVEAATVGLREHLKELTNFPEWDPGQIAWTPAEGPSGPYERSEDVNNSEHKAMLNNLVAHNGKMRRGPYFYWSFQNGHTVGRKKQA